MEVDSAGVTIITNEMPAEEWTLAEEPELTLGSTDGGPAEFYQIRDIAVLPDTRLAVLNGGSEEVRFFSANGEYLGAIGGRGHGPGEYDGLSWVALARDSIFTHDWGNDRVTVLDLSGRYARTFRLEWHYGIVSPEGAVEDGRILGITTRHMVELPHAGLVTDSALLAVYDADGNLLDSIGRFPHNQRVVRRAGNLQTTLGLPFSANGRLAVLPDGFCYTFGVRAEIRCYGEDGTEVMFARVAREPDPVTPQAIHEYWESALASRNERRVSALRRMRDVMVFPDAYPAYSDLIADDQNRLWAQKYRRAGDPQVEWLVFSDGRWEASIAMDTAFQLMRVRAGKLFGVWRDELGVEFVRVYRVDR